MVYTAQSQSLAALEMLVHVDSSELPGKYVLIGEDFDPALARPVELSVLPRHWRSDPPPPEVRAIGDNSILAGVSLCCRFRVPWSREKQFPLNPAHKDFAH